MPSLGRRLSRLTLIALPMVAVSCSKSVDFKQKFANGEKVTAAMDACTGNIGSIQCGKSYTISFAKKEDKWCETVVGFNTMANADITYDSDCQNNLDEKQFLIFGARFFYNDNGEIHINAEDKTQLVGHLN